MGKLVQLAAVGVQVAAVEWLVGAVPELAWVGARDLCERCGHCPVLTGPVDTGARSRAR